METNTNHMDIKTLIVLLVEHEMDSSKMIELIATECGVSSERLANALSSVTTTKRRIKWDDSRIEELVARWNRGEKPSAISRAMGIQTATVYQRIAALRKERSDIMRRNTPKFAQA